MFLQTWEVKQGDPVNRFRVSKPIEARFAQFDEHETMTDRVQYKFVNGFVDVGDLPCRKMFWQTHAGREVLLEQCPELADIYFANGSHRVEFSGFSHYPVHSQRWAACTLHADQDGVFKFNLSTCGGVRVWVNGHHYTAFTPFQRNTENSRVIELSLSEGENEIVVHTEELFERDTSFYFELLYIGTSKLAISLPQVCTNTLQSLEQFTAGLSANININDHHLELNVSTSSAYPVVLSGEIIDMPNEDENAFIIEPFAVSGDEKTIRLPLPVELKPAHYSVNINFCVGTLSIQRAFGVNIMPLGKALPRQTLEERKQAALQYSAREGMGRTAKLLAVLETGLNLEDADDILNSTLKKISLREDCSDFWMVSLLWVWHNHANTKLSDKSWDRVRSSILGYRYWLDEPGNDSMWFWSENHVLCFHVSQLLAGQFFPNELFICSGRNGIEQKRLAKQRLNRWFEHVIEHGLTEWNSSCYYPIDYIGLLAIYQLSDDLELKEKAEKVIDRLMIMGAVHYQAGVAGGTMGRVYEKELLANEMTELAGFGHVAWGDGWHTRMCASLPLFCISDYKPSRFTSNLARLSGLNSIEAFYTQGLDRSGKVIAWKEPGVMLSSAVDHHTGQHGHQQHVVDIQFAHTPKARVWVNHPGEELPGGDGRPSYWAGNGVLPRVMQYKNRSMMLFDLGDKARLNFTHLYLPAESIEKVIVSEHWCFLCSGKAYAAVSASEGLQMVTEGGTRGKELRSYGQHCAWFIAVGHGDNEDDFNNFMAQFKDRELLRGVDPEPVVKINDPVYNEMKLTWSGHFTVNNGTYQFPENVMVDPVINLNEK